MLLGHSTSFACASAYDATHWIQQSYPSRAVAAGLNHLQKQALMLPFREKIGFIEGPPGTGKTHLLVWTLIALVAHAKCLHRPIKILVTAQTHHAIDQILRKVAKTLSAADLSGISLWKYGRFDTGQFSERGSCCCVSCYCSSLSLVFKLETTRLKPSVSLVTRYVQVN